MRIGWGAMLCHVYELRHEISVFMEKKGGEVPAFTEPLLHFSLRQGAPILLNAKLQRREQLINELSQFVSAFETRFRLWETQPRDAHYFPTLI